MFDARCELHKLGLAQRRLLPQTAPRVAAYELALDYRPAYSVTGDYHDFFHRPDGDTAVFVGDGAGHGPAACVLVAAMQAILQTHPELHTDPGSTLAAAGRLFHALAPSDLFMTGVYLLLGDGGRVSWASAGHDPPLRITRLGRVAPADLAPVGFPMGIHPNEGYETVSWNLVPGERLIVFTDGLVEARGADGEQFGRGRLRSVAAGLARLPLAEMVRALVARAAAHLQGTEFEDDLTVVAVERPARRPTRPPPICATSNPHLVLGETHDHRRAQQPDQGNRGSGHPCGALPAP
jgi:sigma-B regulation protein RsbU (phosphoserine phosphatase)